MSDLPLQGGSFLWSIITRFSLARHRNVANLIEQSVRCFEQTVPLGLLGCPKHYHSVSFARHKRHNAVKARYSTILAYDGISPGFSNQPGVPDKLGLIRVIICWYVAG